MVGECVLCVNPPKTGFSLASILMQCNKVLGFKVQQNLQRLGFEVGFQSMQPSKSIRLMKVLGLGFKFCTGLSFEVGFQLM
jgi:hypothetical protein